MMMLGNKIVQILLNEFMKNTAIIYISFSSYFSLLPSPSFSLSHIHTHTLGGVRLRK